MDMIRQLAPWFNNLDPSIKKHTYKLYHHSVTVFWPGFDRGSDKSHTPPFTTFGAVLKQQRPSLFHAMMWQAAMYLSVIHKAPITERDSILHHQNAVVLILAELQNPIESIDESTLWVMLGLATRESGGAIDLADMNAGFCSLGLEPQWLDLYGRRPLLEDHLNALYKIIDLKGGLDALFMPGLAGAIQVTDLFQSTHRLSKPHFPLAQPFRAIDKIIRDGFLETQVAFNSTPLGITTAFVTARLSILGLSYQLHNLDLYFRAYSLCSTRSMGDTKQDLSILALQRNMIHYSLLSTIPTGEFFDSQGTPTTSTNDAGPPGFDLDPLVRTGLLMFSIGVVFPMSNLRVWCVLVERLKVQLGWFFHRLKIPEIRSLLLWLCTLGALASIRCSDIDSGQFFIGILCQIEWAELLNATEANCGLRYLVARPWPIIKEVHLVLFV
jgi:hypothetical protein